MCKKVLAGGDYSAVRSQSFLIAVVPLTCFYIPIFPESNHTNPFACTVLLKATLVYGKTQSEIAVLHTLICAPEILYLSDDFKFFIRISIIFLKKTPDSFDFF
jgi:hypothetical protein